MSVVIEVLEAAISRRKKALAKIVEKTKSDPIIEYAKHVEKRFKIASERPKTDKERKDWLVRYKAAADKSDELYKKSKHYSKHERKYWDRKLVLTRELGELNNELQIKIYRNRR